MDDKPKPLDLSKPLQFRDGRSPVSFVGEFTPSNGRTALCFYSPATGLTSRWPSGLVLGSGKEYPGDVINVPPKPVVTYKNVYPGSQKGGTEWPTLEAANRRFLVHEPRICLLRIERVEGVVTSVEIVKE